jgi:hypothetical protein
MAITAKPTPTAIHWLDDADARAFFDTQARAMLGMSGEEFLRRWDAGEFVALVDDPEHPKIRRLAAMISFAR